MDYRYLEAFLGTAKHLSFTKAAHTLGVTQAAVSRQVRLLEESMGVQLFIRSPQNVVLTPEGEKLFKKSSEFDHWLREDFEERVPVIRIAGLQGIIDSWLFKVVNQVFQKSQVNFQIQTGTASDIDKAILSGKVDLAINSHPLENETLTSFKLFREKIVIVSSRPIDPKALHQYPWVTLDKNAYFLPYCGKLSERVIHVESNNAAIRLVENHAGVTIVPIHLVPDHKKFCIYPLDCFETEYVWATTFNYSKPPKHLNEFIQMLRREAVQL